MHNLEVLVNVEKIISIFYSELNCCFRSTGEKHDFWEIIYIDNGKVIIETSNNRFQLCQGEAYFHEPNEFHKHIGIPNENASICIISFQCNNEFMKYYGGKQVSLSKSCIEMLSLIMDYGAEVFSSVMDNEEIICLIKREDRKFIYEQLLKNYIEILLIEIYLENDNLIQNEKLKGQIKYILVGNNKMLVEEIVKYLYENIYKSIKIEDLCKRFGYGKTTLCNRFKEETNISIIRYFTNLKIEKAKELIGNGDMNLSEIANLLGFSSLNYFSKSFKDYIGMYPREYRKSLKLYNNSKMIFKNTNNNF